MTTTEGPLLIVAGAGTGKTRTLVYRVARLVETGVRPESVLLLTFTRRAAAEHAGARGGARRRALPARLGRHVSLAVGHAVLRKFPELAGVQRNFTVLDRSDTEDLIDLLRRQMRLTRDRRFPRKRTICAIFSMMVNKVMLARRGAQAVLPAVRGRAPRRSKSCSSPSRSSSARATC